MSESMAAPGLGTDPSTSGLSQVERVVDAYVEPSKTFTDIRRSSSWWLPFLLAVIVGYIFVFAIQHEIGWQKVAESTVQNNAQMQQRMSTMTPAQVQQIYSRIAVFTKGSLYASPVFVLVFALIGAAILTGSFNFGLGARAKFSQYFAVWLYAGLPLLLKSLLASITLFAGLGADQFQLKNPVGTNIGFFLGGAPGWLSTLFTSVDIFTIWTVILLVLGCSIVAKVKRNQSAIIVVGWWVLIILGSTVIAVVRG